MYSIPDVLCVYAFDVCIPRAYIHDMHDVFFRGGGAVGSRFWGVWAPRKQGLRFRRLWGSHVE